MFKCGEQSSKSKKKLIHPGGQRGGIFHGKNQKIGIIGVGNCASSLLQGMEYYNHKTEKDAIGLMHWSVLAVTNRLTWKWCRHLILIKEKSAET